MTALETKGGFLLLKTPQNRYPNLAISLQNEVIFKFCGLFCIQKARLLSETGN